MSNQKLKGFINKPIIGLLAILLCLSMFGITFAYDAIESYEPPPPFSETPELRSAGNETVWHLDVNSGCQFSDHYIYLNIDVEPAKIKDAKIKMTNWDVDYNDPQGCFGGPEVDYLYINGHYIGQLQGANNSWSVNTFNLLSSYLVKGRNLIYIDTDAPGTGCWCVGVGYVEISGKVGFQVTSFTPTNNTKNVDWTNPGIEINFSAEVLSSSVNSNTIKLDYRNQGGNWVEANITPTLASAEKVVVTSNSLKDGIRYRMRVLNGPNGVLSTKVDQNGDNIELVAPAEWVFWTMVNLDGQTANLYPPNTTKDKLQITWFNVSRNKDLIPKKRVVNRIYALWDKKDDVFDADEVKEFKANVSFKVNGTSQTKNSPTTILANYT